jgi:hypothetical protein
MTSTIQPLAAPPNYAAACKHKEECSPWTVAAFRHRALQQVQPSTQCHDVAQIGVAAWRLADALRPLGLARPPAQAQHPYAQVARVAKSQPPPRRSCHANILLCYV